MAAVTVVVQGLPTALSETGEQAHGPLAVLAQQLRAVLDLAIRSHPSIRFRFSCVGKMPVGGYNLELMITGLDERLMGSADAEIVSAVLTVVVARFAAAYVPSFYSIRLYPLGKTSRALYEEWLQPSCLDAKSLTEVATTVARWIRILAQREQDIPGPDPSQERPAWAAIRVWAEEVLTNLERVYEQIHGSPLPKSVHLRIAE